MTRLDSNRLDSTPRLENLTMSITSTTTHNISPSNSKISQIDLCADLYILVACSDMHPYCTAHSTSPPRTRTWRCCLKPDHLAALVADNLPFASLTRLSIDLMTSPAFDSASSAVATLPGRRLDKIGQYEDVSTLSYGVRYRWRIEGLSSWVCIRMTRHWSKWS